jgi:hypothetical protein
LADEVDVALGAHVRPRARGAAGQFRRATATMSLSASNRGTRQLGPPRCSGPFAKAGLMPCPR